MSDYLAFVVQRGVKKGTSVRPIGLPVVELSKRDGRWPPGPISFPVMERVTRSAASQTTGSKSSTARRYRVSRPTSCDMVSRVFSPLIAANATFALKAGLWFRRTRLVIVAPVHGNHAAFRPKIHLYPLSRFPEPALPATSQSFYATFLQAESFTLSVPATPIGDNA